MNKKDVEVILSKFFTPPPTDLPKSIPVTIYACKYGKSDKTAPIETEIDGWGNIKVTDEVVLSWVDHTCKTCQGIGTFVVIDKDNNRSPKQKCPCTMKRFMNQFSYELKQEIVKRQIELKKFSDIRQQEAEDLKKKLPVMLFSKIDEFLDVLDQKEADGSWEKMTKKEKIDFTNGYYDREFIPFRNFDIAGLTHFNMFESLSRMSANKRREMTANFMGFVKGGCKDPSLQPPL
jgi:hypothetical protein